MTEESKATLSPSPTRELMDEPPAAIPEGHRAPLDDRSTVEMMAERDRVIDRLVADGIEPRKSDVPLHLVRPPTVIPLGATVCDFVVLDTETSGLPMYTEIKDGKKVTVAADDPRQPYVAQACMVFMNAELEVLEVYDGYVKPDGWEMEPGAAAVNGLTTDFLHQKGIPIAEILDVYEAAIAAGATVVAHNAQFDCKMMRGAFRRAGRDDLFEKTKQYCTMRGWAAAQHVSWPKFAQLCKALGVDLSSAHTALGDATALAALPAQDARSGHRDRRQGAHLEVSPRQGPGLMVDHKVVLGIVRENPGATGLTVSRELVRRTWLGRKLGPDSILATLFGPSSGSVYLALHQMERQGWVFSEWGRPVRPNGPRPLRYYADPR